MRVGWMTIGFIGFLVGAVSAQDELIQQFTSDNWAQVWQAKPKLESLQEKAIPRLMELLKREDSVKLRDTADLIYPGAETFYGHGFIVDYDIDWISMRAGWVLEELTFRRFGFREGAILHDSLLRATIAGNRDVPLDEVVKLSKDPEARRKIRVQAVARAMAWWAEVKASWKRYDDLLEALRRGDPDRQVQAIGWIRYGQTQCSGLDRTQYEKEILPEIQRLSESEDKDVRTQATLLLQDREGSWYSLKGKE